jgi:hypothetical protein
MRECLQCGEDFIPYQGKPGYIWQCPDCATDIELFVAEQESDDDGAVVGITNNPITKLYLKDPSL